MQDAEKLIVIVDQSPLEGPDDLKTNSVPQEQVPYWAIFETGESCFLSGPNTLVVLVLYTTKRLGHGFRFKPWNIEFVPVYFVSVRVSVSVSGKGRFRISDLLVIL